ncbi:hypothetical protein BBP40_009474 [Aspergillus hancockii]|nr:hypothetical protein BBP40_009474 [Aspergillus hancockii]
MEKETSELATLRCVKERTSILVLETLYLDLRLQNPVSAPCVLMQTLPGRHLYNTWDGLSLNHKRSVLSQIAAILTQLGILHFDEIGSLQENGLDLLVRPAFPSAKRDPSRLSGVFDFEYAYTGPLYYWYEHPIFIHDVDGSPVLFEQNAVLRLHFVRTLRHAWPGASPDALAARDVNFILNEFGRVFMLTRTCSQVCTTYHGI